MIRSPEVLLIDKDGKNLGITKLMDAVSLAREDGLELLQISFNKGSPTCKILDVNKHKYNLSLKQKEEAKKQRKNELVIKQIQIRPATSQNDLAIKAKQLEQFLSTGAQIKLLIKFKSAREMSHLDLANEALAKFLEMCPSAAPQGKPSIGQKEMSLILIKKETK